MSASGQRYFVLHLGPEDMPWPVPTKPYEVQVLDLRGRATALVHVGDDDNDIEGSGYLIPKAVIDAARRQRPGQGDYVDEMGQSVPPF